MSAEKKDQGKSRMDLFPWADAQLTESDYRVKEVFDSLKIWWTGRPYRLEIGIPRRQIRGVCDVLAFGANKYAPRNWESGLPFSRVFAAAARHALAHLSGEHLDPETGLTHESALWCNILFLVTYTARGQDVTLDDRPTPSPVTTEKLDRMQALVASLTGTTPASHAGLVDAQGKGSN